MGLAKTARRLAPVVARTLARRLRHGPRGPGWTLRYELTIAVSRGMMVGKPATEAFPVGSRRVARQRRFQESYGKYFPVPSSVRVEPLTVGGVTGERVSAVNQSADAPTLIYLHGGGYISGSAHAYRSITCTLAERGATCVLGLDYRLAPEHVCPAAIDDVLSAWRALTADGLDPSSVVFVGDSAGGGLTVAALARMRDEGVEPPAGAVLLSPWSQLDGASLRGDSDVDYIGGGGLVAAALSYAGDLALDDPRVSPGHGDVSGLPPLFVLVGGAETFRPDGEALVERVHAAGGEARLHVEEGEVHVYPLFVRESARARRAADDIVAFAREVAARREASG